MLNTDLGRLRAVSALEGLSYVVLVFVAMPLKYLAGDPSAVRVVGMIHGLLFMAFAVVLALAALGRGWRFGRSAAVFAWSLVPFGAIVIERMLRREQDDVRAPA